MSFKEFNLSDKMINALEGINFFKPTDVQSKVIPMALKGQKIIGRSATGSGKTHAFLIPMFEKIDLDNNQIQAVILAPTRELAEQIYLRTMELKDLFDPSIRVKRFIGGQEMKKIKSTDASPHIVIGTPGRIRDLFINENILRLDQTKMFVIDEADMTFDSGFVATVDNIVAKMNNDVQFMIFSATIPQSLRPFLMKYLEDVKVIDIDADQNVNPNIEHYIIRSRGVKKEQTLLNLTKIINPYLSLIFSNTKTKTEDIFYHLNRNGVKAGQIHGNLDARKRRQMMKQISRLDFTYVSCSDIAARGMDIEGVTHVISMEVPKEIEFYIHRCGRTARYDNSGISYLIYDKNDHDDIMRLEKLGIDFKHVEIKNGELVELPSIFSRKKRVKKISEEEKQARLKVHKKTKVKPGYKKRRQALVERETRKIKRKNIRKGNRK
jgi:ATP-dependent RNA helicase CshB